MLKSQAIGNQTKWELDDYNLIFVDFFLKQLLLEHLARKMTQKLEGNFILLYYIINIFLK